MNAPKRSENSGLVDLDALLREANEAEASGERPIVHAAPAPTPAPVPAPAPAPAPAAAIESTPALVTPVSPPSPSRSRSRKWLVFPTLGVLLVLFALLIVHGRAPGPVATHTPVVAVVPREAKIETAAPLETVAVAGGDRPIASAEPETAASVIPTTTSSRPATKAASAAVITTSEPIEAAPAPANDLGRAMHDAVGGDGSRAEKNESGTKTSAARTLRPSPGAVIGAINAVLPTARECLGPDDAVRTGTLTFRSDGAVAKVELAGKRASDECIRNAMARARIEPFADDAFTTRITVRP